MSRNIYLFLTLAAAPAFAQAVHLKVDTTQTLHSIDPKIYGQFLEHIYHSVNGGVWGEVVWNRSFEERLSPGDWRTRGGVLVSPPASDQVSRFLIGAETWRDYDFLTDLQRTSGDGAIQIAVRSSRGNNVTVSFEGAQVKLIQKEPVATADLALETGRWYRLHIRVAGAQLQAFLDDKPLFNTKLDGAPGNGQAFLATHNAAAEFRTIQAVALDHTVLFNSLPSPARHWRAVGAGELSLDAAQPLNSKVSLKIAGNAGSGIAQDHFAVRRGDTLRGSFFARGQSAGGVSVRLVSDRYVLAQDSFDSPGNNWTEFPLALTPEEESANATLEISTRGPSTLWIDQVSLTPDSSFSNEGFRPDLLKAIADLHPPIIRWPGGSFIADYRWKDGIGLQAKRVGKNGWDELDPLSFGIDEFITLCRKVGAEPLVVINSGARNAPADRPQYIQDARDLVEYCNAPATSKWGKVRATNGHPLPYNVKYWEIDNEIWKVKADDYVEMLRQFVPAMKQVDPTIKTIACGSGQLGDHWPDGDIAVIEKAADLVDYLSVHHYESPEHFADGPANEDKFFAGLADRIRASKNPNLKLFVSEWNAQSTDWRTGLYAGGLLNMFERNPLVGMASPALFLRHLSAPAWDNALINFDNSGWFPAPNYVVMKLYHDHFAPGLLKVDGDAAGLNVDAAKSADGRHVVVKMVNPSDAAREVSLELSGFVAGVATLQIVAPDSLDARNTLEHPNFVHPVAARVANNNGSLQLTMPRYSVGVLEVASGAPIEQTKVQGSSVKPDLLTLNNGQPVRDAMTWWKSRRPEILEALETEEYGHMPGGRMATRYTPRYHLDLIDRKALSGKAVRKQITISFNGIEDPPKLHLLLYVPVKALGGAPAVLGLNFNGNQTIDADPGIQLPEIWTVDPNDKSKHILVRATADTRGKAASQWQLEKIIERGYAVATIYCGDIEPDFKGGIDDGVRAMFLGAGQENVEPDEWGTIGAWAWGLSRALDYLQTDSDLNPKGIAVFGFSRLGKAAVWAGARDQRFAMVISNESGQGGVSLLQRKAGERLEHLHTAFPYWFAGNFYQYVGKEETLPVDGHMLLALVAPRPAYVGSAEQDTGSDPKGEFLAAVEASRVYRLLGKKGLNSTEFPAVDQPISGDIGYHVRSGKHDVTAYDWDRYLDFMDAHLSPGL
jgi:alpha-N-arabinofuranosidase